VDSYLHLPPDLLVGLDRISGDELNKVLPSQYEILKLSFTELVKQLIENTRQLQDETPISKELHHLLQYWMFIVEDTRLFDISSNFTDIIDLMWYIVIYSRINDKAVTYADLDNIDLHSLEFPSHIYEGIIDPLDQFLRVSGDMESFSKLYLTLVNNHRFILRNPIEFLLISLLFTGPLITKPQVTYELILHVRKLMQKQNLEYIYYRFLHLEASSLMFRGRFEKSLQLYKEVEEYASKQKFTWKRNAKNNRGIILFNTGKWDEAISIYKEILEEDPGNITALNNLADSYSRKGDYEEAWKHGKIYLEKSNSKIVLNYEFLQIIMFELGLDDEAEAFVQKMQQITAEHDASINQAGLKLIEARQARYNLNIGTAIHLLNEALDECLSWKNLPLVFMLMQEKIYSYLDMVEIKPSMNNKQRLFNTVDSFIQLSDQQNVAIGSIQGLSIRSRIHQSFNQIEEARMDMYNAAKLAREFEYTDLLKELEEELTELKMAEEVTEQESKSIFTSIKDRIRQMVGLGSSKEFKENEYITHGLILMNQNGLPVYSTYITDKLKSDSTLISGLISAVSAMLNEATQSEGFLKTITREDFSLIFEPLADYLLVAIVSDDTFEARQRLELLTESTYDLLNKYEILENSSQVPAQFEVEMTTVMEKQLNLSSN